MDFFLLERVSILKMYAFLPDHSNRPQSATSWPLLHRILLLRVTPIKINSSKHLTIKIPTPCHCSEKFYFDSEMWSQSWLLYATTCARSKIKTLKQLRECKKQIPKNETRLRQMQNIIASCIINLPQDKLIYINYTRIWSGGPAAFGSPGESRLLPNDQRNHGGIRKQKARSIIFPLRSLYFALLFLDMNYR